MMRSQIEVIYENGVLRPLESMPSHFQEHQQLLVTIEGPVGTTDWLADADPTASLEDVRQALGKIRSTFADMVHAEREDR
jgi:predicted DNA-binding antitoxin AbrB/MazE fold protein